MTSNMIKEIREEKSNEMKYTQKNPKLMKEIRIVVFDAKLKYDISDTSVRFDEVILFNCDVWWIQWQKMNYSVNLKCML